MPFLRLRDLRTGAAQEFDGPEVRIGRDPEFEFPIRGEGSQVVSGAHARLLFESGGWWLEDLGSRNGTYLDERRLLPGGRSPVKVGSVIRLGESGPRIKIEAVSKHRLEETVVEVPATLRPSAPTLKLADLAAGVAAQTEPRGEKGTEPPGEKRPEPPRPGTLKLVAIEQRTGHRFEAVGGRLRIGRGQECEIRPVGPHDTSVSRLHAEVVLKPDGRAVVRDARSRNGTFLNGERLIGERVLATGDRILLGEGGPELLVESLVLPSEAAAVTGERAAAPAGEASLPRGERARRSFGGKGATVFFKEMFAETQRRSAKRVRVLVWSFVAVLGLTTAGLYLWAERRVRETAEVLEARQREALRAQQAVADSIRMEAEREYRRLRAELEAARAASASPAVIDSLRAALNEASTRAAALEAALRRAEQALREQLAAGDSLRRQAQAELERLRGELARAGGSEVSGALLDSLRRALQAAEERASSIEAQMRAIRGVNLAAVAQANQGAVGLITVVVGNQGYDGTGFVITRSGYMITNRHVVMPQGRAPDAIYVTMADRPYDRRFTNRAQIVSVGSEEGPDLAVLKIENYSGPAIAKVDWSGTRARQGEPAALIGFPAGLGAALDETKTVRTNMSGGIFSKVTAAEIRFDGFTTPGSSGSPIFNANGEVVAVHRAGLKEATGLSFAVPVRFVLPLLPPEAKAELGLN
jgi:pSer/pThr/pTyr-binding forkhead associated (FHA) protein/S1-C subfamily serine protease